MRQQHRFLLGAQGVIGHRPNGDGIHGSLHRLQLSQAVYFDANLAQALHTFNGDTVAKKVADKNGRVMKLIAGKAEHDALVTELYLAALCRLPSEAEMQYSHEILKQSPNPEEGYQDLLWALINSKQFLFVH